MGFREKDWTAPERQRSRTVSRVSLKMGNFKERRQVICRKSQILAYKATMHVQWSKNCHRNGSEIKSLLQPPRWLVESTSKQLDLSRKNGKMFIFLVVNDFGESSGIIRRSTDKHHMMTTSVEIERTAYVMWHPCSVSAKFFIVVIRIKVMHRNQVGNERNGVFILEQLEQ